VQGGEGFVCVGGVLCKACVPCAGQHERSIKGDAFRLHLFASAVASHLMTFTVLS
jgi:hypothetical protein